MARNLFRNSTVAGAAVGVAVSTVYSILVTASTMYLNRDNKNFNPFLFAKIMMAVGSLITIPIGAASGKKIHEALAGSWNSSTQAAMRKLFNPKKNSTDEYEISFMATQVGSSLGTTITNLDSGEDKASHFAAFAVEPQFRDKLAENARQAIANGRKNLPYIFRLFRAVYPGFPSDEKLAAMVTQALLKPAQPNIKNTG